MRGNLRGIRRTEREKEKQGKRAGGKAERSGYKERGNGRRRQKKEAEKEKSKGAGAGEARKEKGWKDRRKGWVGASERVQSKRTKEERVHVGSAGRTAKKDGKSVPDRRRMRTMRAGGRRGGGGGWVGGGGETLLTPPSIQDGVGSGSPRH